MNQRVCSIQIFDLTYVCRLVFVHGEDKQERERDGVKMVRINTLCDAIRGEQWDNESKINENNENTENTRMNKYNGNNENIENLTTLQKDRISGHESMSNEQ